MALGSFFASLLWWKKARRYTLVIAEKGSSICYIVPVTSEKREDKEIVADALKQGALKPAEARWVVKVQRGKK